MHKKKVVTVCHLCGAALPHTPEALKLHNEKRKETIDAFWREQRRYWEYVLQSNKAL